MGSRICTVDQFQIVFMKKIALIAIAVVIILTAFINHKSYTTSGIQGTINPADGAKKIWAFNISGKDTVSVIPSSPGFSIDVKPGTWNLYIEANKPYKDATVSNIIVDNGKYTDAGEIKLLSGKH